VEFEAEGRRDGAGADHLRGIGNKERRGAEGGAEAEELRHVRRPGVGIEHGPLLDAAERQRGGGGEGVWQAPVGKVGGGFERIAQVGGIRAVEEIERQRAVEKLRGRCALDGRGVRVEVEGVFEQVAQAIPGRAGVRAADGRIRQLCGSEMGRLPVGEREGSGGGSESERKTDPGEDGRNLYGRR